MSFELIAVIVTVLVLLPFLATSLAKRDLFFTMLETGDIKFVDRGKTLVKILIDVPGFRLNEENEVVPLVQGERPAGKPWYGLYWIGIPFIHSVHHFKITREVENPKGKSAEEWIEEKEPKDVDSLHWGIPRPYSLMNVELGDGSRVNLLLVVKFQAFKPVIPVYVYKGAFFKVAGSMLSAAVNFIAQSYTIQTFITANKGEGGILADLEKDGKNLSGQDQFNERLKTQTGLLLAGISIRQYEPADEETQKAMEALALAELQAKALVAKKKGEADGEKLLVEVRGMRIKATRDNLAATGVDGNVLVRATADILEMEAAGGPDSKLTTLVKGNVIPTIPVGGGGK